MNKGYNQLIRKYEPPGGQKKRRGVFPVAVIIAVFLLIALGAGLWLTVAGVNKKTPDNPRPEQTEPVEKLTDTIDIPCYDRLIFKAGEKEQKLSVPNPPQNFCWFKVSLILKDGTVLWTSRMIAPGEESGHAVLNSPLEKGEYENAMIKYQCFADEAGRNALNGAETKLTIVVK